MTTFLRSFLFTGLLRKCTVLALLLIGVVGMSVGQVSLTNASPSTIIDFSNTMQTGVGTNTSTAFTGSGFSPNPTNANAGRLNSNAWAVTGWSTGDLAFGGTRITAATDYTRGSTAGAVTTGGFYAYTGAPQSVANPCLMIQPGGSDFAPGTLTLRIQNNGTTNITQIDVSYNLFVRNDGARSNSFNFSHSTDNSTYTTVAALDYASTETADALEWVQVGSSPSRNTSITGLNIAPGGFFYIRWSSADISGMGSRDEFGLDDINISATYNSCLPTTTVTSFSPSSGPAGTHVTIIGTNLTNATGVRFGGIAGTILSQTATTLIAEVPANAITGKITIVEASCTSESAADFTVLTQNANCGTGTFGTNLIISEIFDSNAGSVGYIEIFNPTASAINLNGYYIRIFTGATTNLANFSSFSLASGAVAVIRIGNPLTGGTSLCPSVTLTQTFDLATGFNEDDEISLLQGTSGSGTVIDVVRTPNTVGFSRLRNAGAITPRTTFQSSEWTTADPETCGHLGTPSTSLASSNVTITTQPSDVNCAAVTFSVTANATPGVINYVWRYQAPGSAVWQLVSALNGTNDLIVTGSGTASITITGNTSILKDYQFYCEIGSGGSPQCVKYTNAVQYTYDSRPYYRTIASGQWTNPAIWQMSDTETGTYVAACQYPVADNSFKVNILTGHTVTLDVIDVTIDWVNINSGGALTIGTNSLLNFNNGNTSGADLQVNGTLTDGGGSTSNGVSFSSATWEIAPGATIIRTGTSSSGGYQTNYQGGISTIPANANWIIRGSSTVNVLFTSVGMFYPNLTFESSSGIWNPAAATSRFTGTTGGFATVKGNLDIGGTGAGTVTVYNENTNATAMQILGNLTVRSGSTLTNNGNASGTGFEVKGNVSVAGTLTVNGTGSSGTLIMSGTAPQSISGTGTYDLYSFTVNNTGAIVAGSGVTLNRALSMDGELTLTNGLINTSSTNMFSLTATATCPAGGTEFSFVNGPMRKSGTAAFNFPVGLLVVNDRNYGMIGITAVTAPHTFEALFYKANANLLGPSQTPLLLRVSFCEYWDLTRISGTEDVLVTLSWTPNSNCAVTYINNINAVVVANLNSSNIWVSLFGANRTGDGNMGTVQAISTPSTYPKFALGSTNIGQAPLPFNLNAFTAVPNKTAITLDWAVGNNHQQQQYMVERSSDGRNFETITTVNARQGQTLADYSFDDVKPLNGWNYYRIRATDFENKTNTSTILKVWWGKAAAINILPNPASEKIVINLSAPSSIKEIQIVNAMGQVMRTITTVQFSNEITISSLQAGIYYIRFLGKDGFSTRSFVKQ